jgi:HK97 family phage major capsid protein
MAESDYAKRVERKQSGTDPRELPEKVAREVIQDVEQSSAALQLCNVSRMSTRQERLTLLDSFPTAVWQTGTVDYPTLSGTNASASQRAKDSQPKQTTTVTWDSKTLAAEELAVMVAIPDNFIDDAGAPLFDEVRPMIATAFAKAIDNAVLFGQSTPFAQYGILQGAIANGNIVSWNVAGTGTSDLVGKIATLGREAALDGIEVNKFVTGAGFDWLLVNLRDTTGQPVYSPPTDASPGRIYGRPHTEVTNGTWKDNLSILCAGDWQYARIGIRQDVTFSLSDSATIYDPATQKVVYSAFQQDGKVLRAVMRIAYTVVQPLRHLTNAKNYPFWVLQQQAGS